MMQDAGLESNYPVLSHPCLIQGMLPVNHRIVLCCKGVNMGRPIEPYVSKRQSGQMNSRYRHSQSTVSSV